MNRVYVGVLTIRDIFLNVFSRTKIVLITESAHWSIYDDCVAIKKNLKGLVDIRIAVTPIGLRKKVVHFASINTFLRGATTRPVHDSNTIVLTWFHVADDSHLDHIHRWIERVSLLHTSCSITQDILIKNGVPKDKIVIIPIGVDTSLFVPAIENEKQDLRLKFKIPKNKIVIGSFQKDGNGWGDGDTPKLIKGPDIFCDAVEKINIQYPVHVFLTGPARGYVKKRLFDAGISYSHIFSENSDGIAKYYRLLDIYMITSRAEGGPKALLEASASGVPVVATNVGMVSDLMENDVDCYIVPVGDTGGLVAETIKLITSKQNHDRVSTCAIKKARQYDIKNTVQQYYQKIYKQFIL